MGSSKAAVLYALHSGNLYGTERVALDTLRGLGEDIETLVLAPPGPLHEFANARRQAIEMFRGKRELGRSIRRFLAAHDRVLFFATGVVQSAWFLFWNAFYRRRSVHLHMVHGGTDERLSYGRKRWLNRWPVRFVAVSTFVRERLLYHGTRPERIDVVPNFLDDERIDRAPRRPPFQNTRIRHVMVVSRIDRIKRIDLLLDAVEDAAELEHVTFEVLGTGELLDTLRERAAHATRHVRFAGYCDDVPRALARADLLLHMCPVEPFGMAILEAMAAHVPVLVPDRGGASSLVEDGVTGFHFRADDASDLRRTLVRVGDLPPETLEDVVRHASERLDRDYRASVRAGDYGRYWNEVNA
ncbi:MAG: glycosyltransferase [Planctomycetes bacterium]|nr:glycosyltransferase [Planctomycetota bacterium]